MAILLMALLGLSGLAIDGGELFVARRDTQALADAAARAGASQLDQTAARADPEGPLRLDPSAATEAAATYIADVHPGATITVTEVDATHITVRVTSSPVQVTLLQLAGVRGPVRVQATGEAAPQTGITQPGQ